MRSTRTLDCFLFMKFKIILFIVCLLLLLFVTNKVLAAPNIPLKAPIVPQIKSSAVFERIAQCESKGDLRAKNKFSTASGEFQFLWGTWHKYGLELWGDKFYEKNIWSTDNRELAWYVFQKYGSRDWDASKKCWQ